ncbi:MAG: hypothetical protein ACOC2Q_01570 [Spirochaetota bacterium]
MALPVVDSADVLLGVALGGILGSGPGIGLQIGAVVACTPSSIIVATSAFGVIVGFVLTRLSSTRHSRAALRGRQRSDVSYTGRSVEPEE